MKNVNLLDLPDEILLLILHKLTIIDMLHSLVNVNERFDRLVLNPLNISDLNLKNYSSVHYQSTSMEQVFAEILFSRSICNKSFFTIDYPQLRSLSLAVTRETLLDNLTNESILHRLLSTQIVSFSVAIVDETDQKLSSDNHIDFFELILSLGKFLIDFSYTYRFPGLFRQIDTLNIRSNNTLYSTINKLTIRVSTFNDCLYILNGCFTSLTILIINISDIIDSSQKLDNTKKLDNLKFFSLTSGGFTKYYDDGIIPLLNRMLSLERLVLYLAVLRPNGLLFINEVELYDDFLSSMPLLKKFDFSIHTFLCWPCNSTNIQNDSIRIGYKQSDSYVDENFVINEFAYHFYSLPYCFDCFHHLNNSFQCQGYIFDQVRLLTMSDQKPYEKEFFRKVSQYFPFLNHLAIFNAKAPKGKENTSTPITFTHLTILDLCRSHPDYAKQFLLKDTTVLPCLKVLHVEYDSLALLTNYFTLDVENLNCTHLSKIKMQKAFVRSERFHSYFPFF
ncbi:unnamed protein product [Adineta ricciae]|uniref:F-box domain-containing protein n=1 Tax=Adineta ricciae TaxID=249248 RepID=A0A814LNE1_ADIRI|nr:unnamed protein product [Adineta ricciae]